MTDKQPELSDGIKNLRRFVAFLGFFLLLISQFLVYSQPVQEGILLPPYAWLGIVGLMLFASSQFIRPAAFWQKVSARFVIPDPVFWIVAAVLLSVLATAAVALFRQFTRVNYIPVITVWLLSAVCYIYALSKGFFVSFEEFKTFLKNHRNEILTVLGIMLLAAAFRFYKLGSIPRILDGDEGLIGLNAQATISGSLANPFALWENFGALYLQMINMVFRFFGITPFALRFLPAISGILAVPSVYLFGRQIGGQRIALIAAILLATSHTHIHFSRIASVAYIHGTWLAPLELYFLLSGLDKRESWRTALGGVLLAIHFSVYLTAQVIVALVLAYMLIAFLFLRDWFRPAFRQALGFWGGFLVTILPEAYYIWQNPNEFFNRLGQDGTFQSGWLADTMQSTGQSAIAILFERVVHAFMSLIYYPAIDFYGSSTPMLSMISATIFLIGMIISLWRTRDRGFLLLNGYFWGATLAVGIFAIPPTADTYRMLMAIAPAFVMAAIGLDQILEFLGLGWKTARTAYVFSTASILFSLLIFNAWTYYGDFAGQCRYGGNLEGRFASYLGAYAKTIDNELPVYLLSDSIYFYGSHASTDFLSDRRPITNSLDPIDALAPVTGETIIASPDRIPELEAWARLHPGGQLHYRYDCQTTMLLAYRVP
ncbi:MAG: glycosyltransferase family 39 protein [Chloroflexi bacterium]|nr:glycosyltransferase family 39 protein [Chloroflexota bacterium]